MANKVIPIWKDYYVSFYTQNSPTSYSIYLDDEPIFYGKAWCPPLHAEETYSTKINKICEDYLTNELGNFSTTNREHTQALRTFTIYNEDTNTKWDEVTFIYDWSYDNSVNYNDNVDMNHPINNKTKGGMYAFDTKYNTEKVSTTVTKVSTKQSDCNGNWALYYLNRYGGWDSFLIEGYVSKKNNFTRHNINRHYDNRKKDFGTTPYLTEITTAYEIHSGWLSEKESETLAENIFPSTRLYLHNLLTDDIVPIVVTDADVLYKNKHNSGRKLLNYTINVVASQTEHNKN